MFDISKHLLGVSLIQIDTIARRQIFLIKIAICRPCHRGYKYKVSQDVRHRIASRSQTRDIDLLFARLSVPDECVPVGRRGAGTKIHVIRSFAHNPSNRLYIRCRVRGVRCSRGHRHSRLYRELGGSALLLLISARRELLCAAAFEAQGQGGSEDGDAGQKFQTWVFPNHFLTFKRSRSPKTPNQNGRCHD